MKLEIDLTNQPVSYGKRIIAMIEAFYGMLASGPVSGEAGPEARPPLAQAASTPAPSSVDAATSPSAPEVTQVSFAVTPAPQTPALPNVPAAAAPTEPAAPSTHANGVQVDKEGIPWDARIHSGGENRMNADGTWRKRKGLNDAAYVAKVKAELLAAMAVPGAPAQTAVVPEIPPLAVAAAIPAPEVAVAPAPLPHVIPAIAPPVAASGGVDTAATASIPMPPVAGVPATVPSLTTAHTGADALPAPTTLPEFMPRITSAMMAGTISADALLTAVKQHGLPDLPTLGHRIDLIPAIWATLKATYPALV